MKQSEVYYRRIRSISSRSATNEVWMTCSVFAWLPWNLCVRGANDGEKEAAATGARLFFIQYIFLMNLLACKLQWG